MDATERFVIEAHAQNPLPFEQIEELSVEYGRTPDTKKGRRKKSQILKKMSREVYGWCEKATSGISEDVTRAALESGFETLTTGDQGGRSREWFDREGLAFATGFATSCVAVAVSHKDIGMGASHQLTFRPRDCKRVMKQCLESEDFKRRLEVFGDPDRMSREMRSPNSIKQVASLAINGALGEFAALCREQDTMIPVKGVEIGLRGIDYLEPDEAERMRSFAIKVVSGNPNLNDGSLLGRTRDLRMDCSFGEAGGIIYGGPSHPKYNVPRSYTIK